MAKVQVGIPENNSTCSCEDAVVSFKVPPVKSPIWSLF